jgi:outer membrane receptor for ferrienterochelin and colicins
MKQILILCIAICSYTAIQAQHIIRLSIKNNNSKEALAGASVKIGAVNRVAISDSLGMVLFAGMVPGSYKIAVTYVGMIEKEITILVPQVDLLEVLLEETEQEEEVVVTSTRISRTISNIPTRVETISGEELSEKGNMKPGDIRMLLNESTGIQTQQTSATSYNSSIRIQGLDGRYTQILRDGLPLYSGFSGGLSLMQVAPLDLKQIEVIKGSSSTLYGAGAIAGLVNLVSKTPTAEKELSFLANGTSAGGLDLSGFYSQRFTKIGLTVFGSANHGRVYDPAGIGFTAIPEFERYTINPGLFFYGEKTNANIGFSYVTENRVGGSMDYILKNSPGYFEKNNTKRFTTQSQLTHKINARSQLSFKNSYSRFNRIIEVPSYVFNGLQQSTFTEASFINNGHKTQWVLGANFLTDDLQEDRKNNSFVRDYHYNTLGAFIQNTWSPVEQFSLETGIRGDYTKQFGFEILPRFSAMLKLNPKLTIRLGGGLGYKTPTLFNEEAEKIQFRHILPINENLTQNERSAGANLDINYRTKIGALGFAFNQLFFYTKLNRPLMLVSASGGNYQFVNAAGYIDTRGLETNLRLTYNDFKLFVGYTYADVNTHYNNIKEWFSLTAKHRLNNVLMYEQEGKLKIGAEAYFFSRQKLNDGSIGRSYWILGLMGERSWQKFSVFINFENLADTRQTKFGALYTGPVGNPVFRDIYAPVDGFVVNGGFKLRL